MSKSNAMPERLIGPTGRPAEVGALLEANPVTSNADNRHPRPPVTVSVGLIAPRIARIASKAKAAAPSRADVSRGGPTIA